MNHYRGHPTVAFLPVGFLSIWTIFLNNKCHNQPRNLARSNRTVVSGINQMMLFRTTSTNVWLLQKRSSWSLMDSESIGFKKKKKNTDFFHFNLICQCQKFVTATRPLTTCEPFSMISTEVIFKALWFYGGNVVLKHTIKHCVSHFSMSHASLLSYYNSENDVDS